MEEIIQVLNGVKPGVDFTTSEDFIKDGLLTSLEIVMLVTRLNDAFDVEIGITELRPDNFRNLKAIQAMIERLEEE